MYNWYAVRDQRELCPIGFHVPDDEEWDILETYLGINEPGVDLIRGKRQQKIKDTKKLNKGDYSNDTNDFSTVLTGLRYFWDGVFYNIGIDGCWWSATETDAKHVLIRNSNHYFDKISRIPDYKNSGFSIRCIKDN